MLFAGSWPVSISIADTNVSYRQAIPELAQSNYVQGKENVVFLGLTVAACRQLIIGTSERG